MAEDLFLEIAKELEMGDDSQAFFERFAYEGLKSNLSRWAFEAKEVLHLIAPNVYDGDKVVGYKIIGNKSSEYLLEKLFYLTIGESSQAFLYYGGSQDTVDEVHSYWLDFIIPYCDIIIKWNNKLRQS